MSRVVAWALGCAALAAAVLAGAPAMAKGGGEHRIEVVRTGAGAYLGVVLEEAPGNERGARVKGVEADSAAAKAGIKDGDVIVRFDGESVRSVAHLVRLVRETPAGRTVPVEVSRGGAVQKLQATLGEGRGMRFRAEGEVPDVGGMLRDLPEAPEPPEALRPPRAPRALRSLPRWHDDRGHAWSFERFFPAGPRKLGIRYQEIEGQLAKYFKLAADEAVLVSEVESGSPAEKAGMKAGDVILKLDGKEIHNAEDLQDEVGGAEPGKEATVTVQRDGRSLELKVTLGGEKRSRDGAEET